MVEKIAVADLMPLRESAVVLDVRTPAEFEEGHIPGALNLPLFTNEERAQVGTLYKQKGPDHALMEGLTIVGPKMKQLAERAKAMADGREIVIHCWRGGKRSESVGWLLDFAGLDVKIIEGGYKAYRRFILGSIALADLRIVVVGGRTGCRKTLILHELRDLGEQIIDLEGLANHKGSAFGWIGEEPQPTTQQFENALFDRISQLDPKRIVWIENESKSVGKVYIPDQFWDKMKAAPLMHLDVPLDVRVSHLVDQYADGDNLEELKHSFVKIGRRLGGQHLNAAMEALGNNDLSKAAEIALVYYDKAYDYNLSVNQAPAIHIVDASGLSTRETAEYLVKYCRANEIR